MHMRWTRFKPYLPSDHDISSFDAPCSDYDIPIPFFMCRPLLFPLIVFGVGGHAFWNGFL